MFYGIIRFSHLKLVTMNMLLQEFVSGEGFITELAHMFLGKKFAEICS